LAQQSNPLHFNIRKDEQTIAIFSLFKDTFRLGDNLQAHVDFTDSTLLPLQVFLFLKKKQKQIPPYKYSNLFSFFLKKNKDFSYNWTIWRNRTRICCKKSRNCFSFIEKGFLSFFFFFFSFFSFFFHFSFFLYLTDF